MYVQEQVHLSEEKKILVTLVYCICSDLIHTSIKQLQIFLLFLESPIVI